MGELITVSRPVIEGARYDLLFDDGERITRVQCKSATRRGETVVAQLATCRLTPDGYVRKTYSREDIDAIALSCAETGESYVLPIGVVAGKTYVHLRLSPARNNQRSGVTMAASYRLGP